MFYARPANPSAVAEHCARKYAGVRRKGRWVAETSGFGSAHSASNIIFSNGGYDPWRSGGVLTDLSATLRAVEVKEGAHHLDLMWSDPADPPCVIAARQVEVSAMRQWIAHTAAG